MASLIFSSASSTLSPWLWQPGSAGQCTSNPNFVLLRTTEYCIGEMYQINEGSVKDR